MYIMYNQTNKFRPYMRIIPVSPNIPELFRANSLSRYNFHEYCNELQQNSKRQQAKVSLSVASEFDLRNLLPGAAPQFEQDRKEFTRLVRQNRTISDIQFEPQGSRLYS